MNILLRVLIVFLPRCGDCQNKQHPWLKKVKTRRDSTLMSAKLLANPLSRKDLRTRRSSALMTSVDPSVHTGFQEDLDALKEMQEEMRARAEKNSHPDDSPNGPQ